MMWLTWRQFRAQAIVDLRGHPGLLRFEHGREQRLLAGEVVIHGAARHLARVCLFRL